MAIVEMKRVALLGMNADKDALLRVLQRFGCVQVTEAPEELADYRAGGSAQLADVQEQLGRIRWAIGQLGRFEPKQGMLASMSMPEASEAEALAAYDDSAALMGVVDAVEACERRSGDLKGQTARIRAQMDQLLPWRNLDIPVERTRDTKSTVQFVGTVNNRELPALETAFDGLPAEMEHIGDERELSFIWIIAHRSAAAQVQEALRTAEFAAVHFTGETGTVAQLLDVLTEEQRALQSQRDALENHFDKQ